MDTDKRKPGRPLATLPQATCDRFEEHLATGGTVAAFSRAEGVSVRVLDRWLERREELREARRVGYETLASDCLEIADASEPERVAVDRLRIDTRRWLLSRWSPERYGEAKASPSSGATVVVVTGVPRSEIPDPGSENRDSTPTPGRSPLDASRAGGEEHNISNTQIPSQTQIPNPSKPRVTVEIDPPVSEDPPLEG